MNGNHHAKPWHGIPREEICWYPLVESCKCDGCGLCVTSCPSEALAFDFELNLAFAVAPHRCLVGCSACATLCPNEAIHLPGRRAVQEVIARHAVTERTRRELKTQRRKLEAVLPSVSDTGDPRQNVN